MAELTAAARKRLKPTSFVFPGERRYPIEDPAHARNALARVSQFGSPSEQARVKAAVGKKFQNIGADRKKLRRLQGVLARRSRS